MNLFKSFSLMSVFTFVSRLLGYIRDFIFAFIFGASSGADSFLLAYRLPNLFRRLFAEGAINNALIPLYLDIKKKSNKKLADKFSNYVFTCLIIILFFVTILVEIFMTEIITLLAPGFNEELINKTSFLASIMFPYLILISISSFIGALLNAEGRYVLWAFSPIILNIGMIIAMSLSYFYLFIPELILAWLVILSGIIQMLIMLFWALRKKIKLKIERPKLTKQVKKLFSLLLPNILAGGVLQINQFVGVIYASSIAGAISWLYYADRIVQLPIGIFIISISTILLTVLSKQQLKKNKDSVNKSIESAFLLMLCLTLLSMVGLLAISDLIVDILFKRGQFGLGDVFATSDAIVMYALGLPAFGMIKVFSVIFFSKKNTLIPFVVSSFSMLVNLLFILFFIDGLGHLGIALSLSLSSYINAIILYIFLWKKNYWSINKKTFQKTLKVVFSAFFSYIVLIISYMLVLYLDYFNLAGLMSKTLTLLTLIALATVTFISLLVLFKVVNIRNLINQKFKYLFMEQSVG